MTTYVELDVNLIASNKINELVVSVLSAPITEQFFHIYGIATIDAEFNPEIHGRANSSQGVNFTIGFDYKVKAGSEVLIPLEHLENSLCVGFNESTMTPLPFTFTTGDIEISLELSFRPLIKFSVRFPILDKDYTASTFVDTPKHDIKATNVKNVPSTCDPAPVSVLEDQTYPNLTNVKPSIGFDAFIVFTENDDNHLFEPLDNNHTIPTDCFSYKASAKTLGLVGPTGSIRGKSGASERAKVSAVLMLVLGLYAAILLGVRGIILSSNCISICAMREANERYADCCSS